MGNYAIVLFALLVGASLIWMGFQWATRSGKKPVSKKSTGSGGSGGTEMNQGAPQK